MLIKGITQLNKIISQEERDNFLATIKNANLNNENDGFIYGNSFGSQLIFENEFDRLTKEISLLTGLKLEKANSYSRIYKNGSKLGKHRDREGLDLTISIQLENTFENSIPIFAQGYDGTVYQSDLNDRDGVLIKGRELNHWREEIVGNGNLICVFFHWKIVSLEYIEFDNFLSNEECEEIIKDDSLFHESYVLQDKKSIIDKKVRSNKSKSYINIDLDKRIKAIVGELDLEGFQLLKYEVGNKFVTHYDYGVTKHRLFTTLIYLNDDYVGGETYFPDAKIRISPKKGKLLIFKNTKADEKSPQGLLNPLSLHESIEIKKGTKYALVNWALVDK